MNTRRMQTGEPRRESGDCADFVAALQNLAAIFDAPVNAPASWSALLVLAAAEPIRRMGLE
jgi:hypothetical protein